MIELLMKIDGFCDSKATSMISLWSDISGRPTQYKTWLYFRRKKIF